MRTVLVAILMVTACGNDGGGAAPDASDGPGAGPDAALGEDLDMTAADFGCIQRGTHVRQFFVWNLRGHLDQALAVAGSATGGTYPVGTVIQLVPQEAMVKRAVGWNPTTNDWEFFALQVSGTTTTISARGVENVANAFGGNCFNCHAQAQPQWDLICEKTHGCAPLQISDQLITNLQNGDSRCP